MKPVNLRCEYCRNPLGLEEKKPRFSWELRARERDKTQKAYRILVSSAKEILKEDRGDIWDSGRVESERTVNVSFSGSCLEKESVYYWKVKVWDEDFKESEYSETAFFEMGVCDQKGWLADWITQPDEKIKGPLYRKEFTVKKDIEKARAYISGLGYYELRLNGEKIGEEVLAPGWTDYKKRVLYATRDIGQYLSKGENVVGVMLGNGRYSTPDEVIEKTPNSLVKFGKHPVLIVQVKIKFSDGTEKIICSDDSWKVSSGPVQFNDIYDGERYNACLEKEGWDRPGFDDSDWVKAVRADPAPEGRLVSQTVYPVIKVNKTIQPRKIFNPEPGVYIVDFGQNFTGWVMIKGRGKKGDKVKLRYAELLNDSKRLNTAPNRKAEATDVYVFNGIGEEKYEPRFTYHGFRYVEITGFPGTLSLENIEGRVVHTNVEAKGQFYCSRQLINKIHNNVLWGQKSNLMSIPTDCPQRDERMGWLGDAQLVAEEANFNFQMIGFFRKWMADLRDAQKEDGSLPDVVPAYWTLYPADPAWGTACVVIPWYLYKFHNDRRVLKKNYRMIKKYVNYLDGQAEKNIISGLGKYGDWCPPWHVHSVDTPLELVSTWYYYHDTLLLARIAGILDKKNDQEKYQKRAEKIKRAFNQKFLGEKGYCSLQDEWYVKMIPDEVSWAEKAKRKEGLARTFKVESQTSNTLPLYLNMVPEAQKEKVLKSIIHDLKVVHNYHLNTGIIGTRYLFDVLADNGFQELAYQLITQETYPGWGYMIKEGATTLWERWEYLAESGMNSHNHIMLGTVDTWFYKILAGINLDQTSPGFGEICIKPVPVSDIKKAAATVNTDRGPVTSEWFKEKDKFNLNVSIPANTTAQIFIPELNFKDYVLKEGNKILWKNNRKIAEITGIRRCQKQDKHLVLKTGSGDYHFSLEASNTKS